MEIKPVELVGRRARLVPLEKHHITALYQAAQHAEIWTYMPMDIKTMEDMELLVDKALTAQEKGQEFPFVIHDQATDRIVGSTRFLDISILNRSLEIGWTWLSPEVWRTRINTEAKYLLLTHCFETLGTIRVQLKTDARNIRSQQAIERIGATKEGILRKHRIMHDGFVRDSVYYSVIFEEWTSVKQRLETLLLTTGSL